jgi:hypothetical protein
MTAKSAHASHGFVGESESINKIRRRIESRPGGTRNGKSEADLSSASGACPRLQVGNVQFVARENHVRVRSEPAEGGVIRVIVNGAPIQKSVCMSYARKTVTLLHSVDRHDSNDLWHSLYAEGGVLYVAQRSLINPFHFPMSCYYRTAIDTGSEATELLLESVIVITTITASPVGEFMGTCALTW